MQVCESGQVLTKAPSMKVPCVLPRSIKNTRPSAQGTAGHSRACNTAVMLLLRETEMLAAREAVHTAMLCC
jgi:hypothetical protein